MRECKETTSTSAPTSSSEHSLNILSETTCSGSPRPRPPAGAVAGAPRPQLQPREVLRALLTFGYLCHQARRWRLGEFQGNTETKSRLPADVEFVVDEALHVIAERALVVTGAEGIAIALPEGDAIVCRVSAGVIVPDSSSCIDPNSGFSGACLRAGRTVRCDDVENDGRVDPLACRELGARSMVAVPLVARREVIGLLEAFSSQPRRFSIPDAFRLSLLGEIIVAAIKPEDRERMAAISQRVIATDVARI